MMRLGFNEADPQLWNLFSFPVPPFPAVLIGEIPLKMEKVKGKASALLLKSLPLKK